MYLPIENGDIPLLCCGGQFGQQTIRWFDKKEQLCFPNNDSFKGSFSFLRVVSLMFLGWNIVAKSWRQSNRNRPEAPCGCSRNWIGLKFRKFFQVGEMCCGSTYYGEVFLGDVTATKRYSTWCWSWSCCSSSSVFQHVELTICLVTIRLTTIILFAQI